MLIDFVLLATLGCMCMHMQMETCACTHPPDTRPKMSEQRGSAHELAPSRALPMRRLRSSRGALTEALLADPALLVPLLECVYHYARESDMVRASSPSCPRDWWWRWHTSANLACVSRAWRDLIASWRRQIRRLEIPVGRLLGDSLRTSKLVMKDAELQAIAQQLTSLTSLEMQCMPDCPNHITDEGVVAIRQLSQLEQLSLPASDRITDRALLCIADGCPQLEDLTLHSSSLTSRAVRRLGVACQLKHLRISGSPLGDFPFSVLAQHCLGLQTLHVQNCGLRGPAVGALHCCTQLRDLSMPGLSALAVSDLADLATACAGSLEVIDLRSCNLTDEHVASLAQCHRLRRCSLASNVLLTDEGLIAMGAGRAPLREINVDNCILVGEEWILAVSLAHLISLHAQHNRIVHVDAIAATAPELERLDLRGCVSLDPTSLAVLQEPQRALPKLGHLDVTLIDGITIEMAKRIVSWRKDWSSVKFSDSDSSDSRTHLVSLLMAPCPANNFEPDRIWVHSSA